MTRNTLLATLLVIFPVFAHATSPEGYFVTVDDKTEQPRGLVEFVVGENGELKGLLRGSFDPSEDFNGVCETCSDDLYNQPVAGLPFVWGLEPDGPNKFKKGRIMDPESGKTYKSKVKFSDNFSTAKLRGYIGTPALGRTQTWRRATAEEIATVNANLEAFGIEPLTD